MGEAVVDRAHPLPPRARRPLRRGDSGGGGGFAPPAERPPPRCRRGRPGGSSHGDDVRAEPARPLSHEARGYEGGAHRAVGRRARSAGEQGHGVDWRSLVTRKTLLVFGARHLGRTLCRELAREGWNIAAVARSPETVASLQDELPQALAIAADACRAEDGEAVFAATQERFGGIDLVVNAVTARPRGTFGGGELAQAPPDVLEPYVHELLPAVLNVLRTATRALCQRGQGTIVQITGGSARRGMAGKGPWAAAA
ncbi:MAG: hypothetical protein C4307_05375 [Chloroflexota bacterium]